MTEPIDDRLAALTLTREALFDRDAPLGLAVPGLVSANGHCRFFRTLDGWVALNLARTEDRDLMVAFGGEDGEPWALAETAANRMTSEEFRQKAVDLQLPVAIPAEAAPLHLAQSGGNHVPRRVLDMSALWAGPLCAGLLAKAGAEVTRLENIGRPDPTPQVSPMLDQRLNGAKTRIAIDLRTPEGQAQLLAHVERTDVLVTSARPAALARLGLDPARFAGLDWVAITAHGFSGEGAQRVGFGDDCAVAGGLVDWRHGEPQFKGDALADPLTGLEGALAILSGQAGLIDMAMARVAAAYATMM